MSNRKKYRAILCSITAGMIAFSAGRSSVASEVPDESKPQAEAEYLRMIEDESKKFGEFAEETTDTRLHYINFLKNRGEYRKAEELCRPIIAAYETSGRSDAHVLARIEDQLGRVLRHQASYAEAELYQRKALAIYEKKPRYYAPVISDGLVNLAKVLALQPDKLQEAKQMFLRALDIELKRGKDGNPSDAAGNLGHCLILTGETTEARKYLLPLVTSKESSGLPRDSYASLLQMVGDTYFKERQYDQASKYLQQAISYLNKAQPGHPKIAYFLCSVADVQLIQGNYGLAAENLRKSLKISAQVHADRFEKLSEKQRFIFLALYSSLGTGSRRAPSTLDIDLEYSTLKALEENSEDDKIDALNDIYQKRLNELGALNPLTNEVLLQIAVQLQRMGGTVKPLVDTANASVMAFATDLLLDDKKSLAATKSSIKALGGRTNATEFVMEELLLLAYLNGHYSERELAIKNLLLAERCLEARYFSQHVKREPSDSSQLSAEKLLKIAAAWLALGNYQEATTLSERALASTLDKNVDSRIKLETLLQLGNLSLAESDIESATQYAKEAERTANNLLSADATEFIPLYKLWAQIKFAMRQYDEARGYATRALDRKSVV